MAIKFDFNKLRTAVLGWLGGTDTTGAALTSGEQAVYVPKMRLGFQVVDMSANITLTAEDSGKIFHINGGGAYQVTLPTAPEDGLWYRFVNTEVTPSGDVTIAAGSGIIAGPCKDSGGDVGVGTAGTEVQSIVFQTEAEIGDNVELISVGGFYCLMHGGSSIADGITMTAA